MTATMHRAGIARRENGVPPPDVPLADIDLGTLEFWAAATTTCATARSRRCGVSRRSPSSRLPSCRVSRRAPAIGRSPGSTTSTMPVVTRRSSARSRQARRSTKCRRRSRSSAGSMISLDDPRHLRLRTIVNRAFTPKVVARIEDSVRDRARTIVDEHDRRPSRRPGRLRRRGFRLAAAAGHLRHDGHPGRRRGRRSSTGRRDLGCRRRRGVRRTRRSRRRLATELARLRHAPRRGTAGDIPATTSPPAWCRPRSTASA